ncbi:MAG: hypothetical protein FWE36_05190 [Erysipelotrichales bacterium]|nr:hypothetical protein [Erysipelotrichales bacterium]
MKTLWWLAPKKKGSIIVIYRQNITMGDNMKNLTAYLSFLFAAQGHVYKDDVFEDFSVLQTHEFKYAINQVREMLTKFKMYSARIIYLKEEKKYILYILQDIKKKDKKE